MPTIAPSSGPTIVLANATGSTSLYLEWAPPTEESHNGIIRSYSIVLTEEPTGASLTYETEDTSREIESLHPYYRYRCQVHAFTVSRGPPSDPVFIKTLEDGNVVCQSGTKSTLLSLC